VIRPSGTSTSTVGLRKANGNATYRASLSSVAVLVQRFSMSIHGRSSYSVTTEVSAGNPSSVRATTSLIPMPGRRSRRAEANRAVALCSSGAAVRCSRAPSVQSALAAPPVTYTSSFRPDHAPGFTPSRPAAPRRGGAPDPEQSPRQLLLQRRRGAVQEPPLVLPLRDRLPALRVGHALGRAPGVLAEQQQVPPDLAALVGPAPDPRRPVRVGWFRLRVPEREQLGGARRELRAAVARQLRGRGGGAVLPVQPGIAAPHRKLRTEAPLHGAKKVLRPARDDAWVGVAPAELFEVVHQPLVGERVVPLGAIQQRQVV